MAVASNIQTLFFSELKKYNGSNYKALHSADLSALQPEIVKAFSSVITRYFIFCEKHPEISDVDKRFLYYRLKIDMIARFFSNYPDTNPDDLVAFQTELNYFEKESRDDEDAAAIAI